MKTFLFAVALFIFIFVASSFSQDSLKIQYSIIGMEFCDDYDIIKVKVPNWLTTSQLMAQLMRVIIWPGEPLPKKKTFIYAFKDTDQIGDTSETGAIYFPGRGFHWDLSAWQPDSIAFVIPSDRELLIYNTLTDTIIKNGSSLNNRKLKQGIAKKFNISLRKLDSVFVKVKFWWSVKSDEKK